MVINTGTWEKTHGFTDCIASNATRQEFKIINALASRGGSWDRDGLSKFLNIENNILDTLGRQLPQEKPDRAKRQHLSPPSAKSPSASRFRKTKLDQWLVTKPTKHALRVKKRYRCSSQIENIARAAFGNDFAIRKTTEIFLPFTVLWYKIPTALK